MVNSWLAALIIVFPYFEVGKACNLSFTISSSEDLMIDGSSLSLYVFRAGNWYLLLGFNIVG